MTTVRPPKAAWLMLVVVGALAVVMGLAFVFARPLVVLLPEDQRFTGLTPDQLRAISPQLFTWMGMVFRSWGAFAIGLGVAIIGLAAYAYRRGETWAEVTLAITGATTFGIFLTVNLMLGSDFKFVILGLLLLFSSALVYGRLKRR